MMSCGINSSSSVLETQGKYEAPGVRWRLGDALPARSGRLFTTFLEQLEAMIAEFENSRNELGEILTPSRFLELLRAYDRLIGLRARLDSYAVMYFSEDTRSQDARTFKSRVEEIETDSANRTLFFELWWKTLDDSKAEYLAKSAVGFSYFLERLRKTRPYTLSEQVEQAINLKDATGKTALIQLYHQIIDSLSYDLVLRGEEKRLTQEQVRDLFFSRSREQRKLAYETYLNKVGETADVVGEIYKTISRDWRNEGIKLRKYSTPIEIRNVDNDVPSEAVENLLNVTKESISVFQRFFQVKARLLGLSDFARYDVYAPVPELIERQYSWSDGMKLVLDTFETFNSEFAHLAKNLFIESHIDAESRVGKMSGAYCMSVTPEIIPFVLLTYSGSPRSVSTLAHELGHAVHSQLSSKNNNALTFQPTLPLAETASVFGEQLLLDRLMSEADEATKRSLLVSMLDGAYQTIERQAFFALFEKEAHEKIATGVNVNELSDLYLKNLTTQFGPGLTIPEYFKNEWLGIPHIFQSPFYCYAYAWGNLLVLALYKQFKQEGTREFAPRYMRLLSRGGSEAPSKILEEAGFDISSKAFWQSGFEELSRSVSELEKIA
jgi:oligoendopeptidase F